jgi:hypothetical protein
VLPDSLVCYLSNVVLLLLLCCGRATIYTFDADGALATKIYNNGNQETYNKMVTLAAPGSCEIRVTFTPGGRPEY